MQKPWHQYREHRTEIILTLLISLFLLVTVNQWLPSASTLLSRMDNLIYDLRVRYADPLPTTEPKIVIVEIDDHAIEQEGIWPWSRERIAHLVQTIGEQQPRLIVLDMFFGKRPDVSTAQSQLLAETLRQYPTVSGFFLMRDKLIGDAPPLGGKPYTEFILESEWDPYSGYLCSSTAIQQAVKQQGHLITSLDKRGMVRGIPLFLEHQEHFYPSLSLSAAMQYLDESHYQTDTQVYRGKAHYNAITIGADHRIATDGNGHILVPFTTDQNAFLRISAAELLNPDAASHDAASHDALEHDSLKNAVVFLGASSSVLGDTKPTPLRPDMPGVEIHAHALMGLLNPDILKSHPAWNDNAVTGLLVLLTLLIIVLFPLNSPAGLLLSGAALLGGLLLLDQILWHQYNILLNLLPQLLLVLLSTLLFVGGKLLHENHHKQRIHNLFGRYIPPEHIQHLIDHPNDISLEGERREMTVLFADLKNFTAIAEHLRTQQLKRFLNAYLTPVTRIIFDHNGTIDKYIGDMVMAFWNAPLPDTQHAPHALDTALALQALLRDKQEDFAGMGINNLQLTIGINTGEMNVGDMGSEYRRSYTVLGDAVNLASRLENLTRYYGVNILVSEATQRECPHIEFRLIDRITVKGKRKATNILHPLGRIQHVSNDAHALKTQYELAFQHYQRQEWTIAREQLTVLKQQYPQDRPTQMLLARVEKLLASQPPKCWDGVFHHREK